MKIKVVSKDLEEVKASISSPNLKLKAYDGEYVRKAYSPYVDKTTGTWFEYDELLKVYKDTGLVAKGEKGDKGEDGKNGADGLNGKDGKDGIDGKNGTNGKDGKDGLNGKDGIDGKNYTITSADYEAIAKLVPSGSNITKLSQLENDIGFITSSYHDANKQDKITSANKLDYSLISNTPTIPKEVTDTHINELIDAKLGVIENGAY